MGLTSTADVRLWSKATPCHEVVTALMDAKVAGRQCEGEQAGSQLGIVQQRRATSSPQAPCPGQIMPTALQRHRDPPAEAPLHTGPRTHGANDFEELGVNAPFFLFPSLFFYSSSPPPPPPHSPPTFCLSSRQAVKDPLQLSRQQRITKTVL